MRPSAAILGASMLAALVFVSGSRSAPRTQVVKVAPAAAAAALTPAWTTYHLDNRRSGNDTSEGIVEAILAVGEHLKSYFPRANDDVDELPNELDVRS